MAEVWVASNKIHNNKHQPPKVVVVVAVVVSFTKVITVRIVANGLFACQTLFYLYQPVVFYFAFFSGGGAGFDEVCIHRNG